MCCARAQLHSVRGWHDPARGRTAAAVAALILACLGVGSIVYLAERHTTGEPVPPRTYRLVWSDELNGPAASTPKSAYWKVDSGGTGWGNRELQYYTSRSSNVRLDGAGHLVITARRETYTGPDGITRDYTSAQIETLGRKQFEYGRIRARIWVPEGQGLWPALWAIGNAQRTSDPCRHVFLHGAQADVHGAYLPCDAEVPARRNRWQAQ